MSVIRQDTYLVTTKAKLLSVIKVSGSMPNWLERCFLFVNVQHRGQKYVCVRLITQLPVMEEIFQWALSLHPNRIQSPGDDEWHLLFSQIMKSVAVHQFSNLLPEFVDKTSPAHAVNKTTALMRKNAQVGLVAEQNHLSPEVSSGRKTCSSNQ